MAATAGLLRRLPGRTRGCAHNAAARSRHHLLYECDGQRAWRPGVCGIFIRAKFGLRAVAQAMARELGPWSIHVVHLLIDAGVDSEAIHQRMKAAMGIEASEIPQIA